MKYLYSSASKTIKYTHTHRKINYSKKVGPEKLVFQIVEKLLRKLINKNYNQKDKITPNESKIIEQSKNHFNINILNIIKERKE